MRPSRSYEYLVGIFCLAFLLGCHEKVATPTPTPTQPVEAPKEEPKVDDSTTRLDVNRGVNCRDDRDCNLYLRCLSNLCDDPPAMTGRAPMDTPIAKFLSPDGTELGRFQLELAVAPHEQSRGLMFRRSMLPDWGMLFIYPRKDILTFWMKNTYIPLDMVFIDDGGTVVGVVTAEPLTLTPRSVGKPSQYVLELVAGTAERIGISAGTVMILENIEPDFFP